MTETVNGTNFSKKELMNGLISQISAYIEQYHGGAVELISYEGDEVKVRLGGACVGCALSEATLKGWVEGTVQQFFPDVNVIGVD